MSNRDNHRRGESKRTENGPRWEGPNPGEGCNSTHVARGRAEWKRLANRAERRQGQVKGGVLLSTRIRPAFEADED